MDTVLIHHHAKTQLLDYQLAHTYLDIVNGPDSNRMLAVFPWMTSSLSGAAFHCPLRTCSASTTLAANRALCFLPTINILR